MHMRTPYQNVDLHVMRSSNWYPIPMAPQEPNLSLVLMMIQMLPQMRKLQYQPISAANIQEPYEFDIPSVILRSQQRNPLMDKLKYQAPEKETVVLSERAGENKIKEVLSSEEDMVQPIGVVSDGFEGKDEYLKSAEQLVDLLTDENDRLKQEIKIVQEELLSCRKNKEEEIKCNSIDSLHQVTVVRTIAGRDLFVLDQSFRPGSKIVVRGRAKNTEPRLRFNFLYPEGKAFHFDNRWNYLNAGRKVVMNTYSEVEDSWGEEVEVPFAPIERGQDFVLSVQCEKDEFKICVNGSPFATYSHRVDPGLITAVDVVGAAEITSVYYHGVEQEAGQDDDGSHVNQVEWDDELEMHPNKYNFIGL